ncbi:DUF2778 domain-containing protein [Paraburkholderia sp. MMS20-SJTN17]|uniref:DUF2778 domain-containing protein n=1 Tax=Paraburkholderia translucens TaxID=2886945 RepID=A0ABS8KCH9_9BURK|nr:tlde1 domain-containing protein [Paraburkholderia sp. MMS20-SJTN17]MCC8402470.1 DUF2778 domain-containing protein [Paraburkholderia sp. MMS20-SJTN17]
MVWRYQQSTGRLYHNENFVSRGYSGKGVGKNNPSKEGVANVGPIPRGTYRIGEPFLHKHAGGDTLRLTPIHGTHTYGRDGFLIHGDSIKHPGQASNGCIIESPTVRTQIWNSGDHILEVVY